MRRQGTVRKSDRIKRFAVIQAAGSAERALAFFSDVTNDSSLAENDVVTYEEERDARGVRAIRVRRVRA